MRTYLVTGGAGFIGSNYIHYMFKKYDNEIRIINVDVLTYAGNLENLKDIEDRENYTFVKADICDKEAIAKIFAENDIDRVVHFAAESHVDSCRMAHSRKARSSCMYRPMRCTVPFRTIRMHFSMRHHHMNHTAHILQVRQARICL